MTSAPRIPSHLILSGLLRQCDAKGVAAFYRHKGDQERGAILIILEGGDGPALLLERIHDFDGRILWRQKPVPFPSNDLAAGQQLLAVLNQMIDFDGDINILEIEAGLDQLELDAPLALLP